MIKRLEYSQFFDYIKKSWDVTRGVTGIVWLGFALELVVELAYGAGHYLLIKAQVPYIIVRALSGLNDVLVFMIMGGVLVFIMDWSTKKVKDIDLIFCFMSPRKFFYSAFPLFVIIYLNGFLLVGSGFGEEEYTWWSLVSAIWHLTLGTFTAFAMYLIVYRGERSGKALRTALKALLHNFDVVTIFDLFVVFLLIWSTLFTLGVGLFFTIPLYLGYGVVLWSKVFNHPLEETQSLPL